MSKRRRNGEGTIYKNKDGYWVALYYVDGKRKSVGARTQAEVKTKLRDKLNELPESPKSISTVTDNRYTFGEWADEWLELYGKPTIKVSTYENYYSYVKNQIKPYLGKQQLSDITGPVLQRYFITMGKEGNTKNSDGLSVKSLYNLRNFMHYMLDQAVVNGLIPSNPVKAVKLPRRMHKEMRVLSKKEQCALIAATDASPEAGVLGIKFALFTGVRLGELLGLKWDSVDLENQVFKIKEILRRMTDFDNTSENSTIVLSLQSAKTQASMRTVPIIDELNEELILYKRWHEAMRADNPDFNPQNFVFVNKNGGYIEPRTYQDIFARTVKAAGIPKANFHCLRHTFATRAIEQGMDILVLAKILGHAQASTTLNMYGHVLPDHKRESMEKIRGLWTSESPSQNVSVSEEYEEPAQVVCSGIKVISDSISMV